MGVYRYIAVPADPGGSAGSGAQRGELTADSAYQVRRALRKMGLLATRVTEVAARQGGSPHPFALAPRVRSLAARALRNRRRGRLVELYESLSVLLASGTHIAPALELLAGTEGGRSRNPVPTLCRLLAERVRHGCGLADAMAEHPGWFTPIDTALIRSAEHNGETERALRDLAEHHARSEELRGRLAGALAYPALLSVFGLGVVVFLTTSTLPQLAGVLGDAGVDVPPATALLLAFGRFITAHWPIALFVIAALAGLLAWIARAPRLAAARLRLPLIGPVLKRSQAATASLLLSRLLDGGIPLTEALALAAPTLPNQAIRSALTGLAEELRAGRPAAAYLRSTGLFEPVFCRVVEVGEQSGELTDSLKTIGSRQRDSAVRLIDRLASALEPAAILTLAAMIGFVVYAAVTPMLRVASTL